MAYKLCRVCGWILVVIQMPSNNMVFLNVGPYVNFPKISLGSPKWLYIYKVKNC